MKTALRISIWLNLILLGTLSLILIRPRKEPMLPAPSSSKPKPLTQTRAVADSPASPQAQSKPFRWSQIESKKSYRIYIANLRAIGCPERTIEAIIWSDADQAFEWERKQLNLDGSGNGPWSQLQETQLVANLLGKAPPTFASTSGSGETVANGREGVNETAHASGGVQNQTTPVDGGESNKSQGQNATEVASAYPLFLQNVNWGAMGFNADQQAAIAQVRQQFQNEVAGLNQNSSQNDGNSTGAKRWQAALQNANTQLNGLLGEQAYTAYEQQQYYAWFQPQVMANMEGGNLNINPAAFSVK